MLNPALALGAREAVDDKWGVRYTPAQGDSPAQGVSASGLSVGQRPSGFTPFTG